jgi:hypothetical protein
MNYNDIYSKTPAGEEAMIHRAKIEERQQRMILVLIDGKTSVGVLREKTGDSASTDAAIETLTANGFIALTKAGDNTPPPKAPPRKPVEHTQRSTFGRENSPDDPESALMTRPMPPPTDVIIANSRNAANLTSQSHFVLPPLSPYRAPPTRANKAAQPGNTTAAPEEKAADKSGRFPLRFFCSLSLWQRRALWACGGVLLAMLLAICGVFASIYLYSYDKERQQLEGWLTQSLDVPVRIGQITPRLSPPELELRQVQIGDASGQNRIEVVRLPGLFSRLFGQSSATDAPVEISGGSLDAALLSTWRKNSVPNGMTRIHFQQMKIRLGERSQAAFEGEILLAPDGGLQRANLHSGYLHSGYLQLDVTPLNNNANTYTMATQLNYWQPWSDSPLQIEHFVGAIQLHPDRLRLENGDIRLLGGHYKGDLELKWPQGKAREIRGNGVLTGVRITELLNVMGVAAPTGAAGKRLELTGELSGALNFHTRGDTPELWRKNLKARGAMKVEKGVLQGMDLIRLTRSGGSGKITQRSGLTRFLELGFDMNAGRDGLKLDNLQFRATSLRGKGEVSVNADGNLSGQIGLLLFEGEGLPGSVLILDGHYPNLTSELRYAPTAPRSNGW